MFKIFTMKAKWFSCYRYQNRNAFQTRVTKALCFELRLSIFHKRIKNYLILKNQVTFERIERFDNRLQWSQNNSQKNIENCVHIKQNVWIIHMQSQWSQWESMQVNK